MLASMPPTRIVLIHGAATTAAIWQGVSRSLAELFPQLPVVAPQRAYSADMATEVDALAAICAQAVVVGVSGGATLGLALLAAGVPLAGAVLHEPAVGSLAPGLLAPVAEAYASGGVTAFGAALYGPAWTAAMAPTDPDAVRRDLVMFRAFEPVGLPALPDTALTTVGARSPAVRYEAARALQSHCGLPYQIIDGCGHAAHLERPEALASLAGRLALRRPPPHLPPPD
jgi:pimeloyl-ACP methyl ester carboxylesterase